MNAEFFLKWLCSIFSSLFNVKISTTIISRIVALRWGRECSRVTTSNFPTPAEIIGAVHGWRKVKRAPFPKICHTYPAMMNLTVLPYLKKIQKRYESCNTLLEFYWHQHYLPKIRKFCYIKKYRYRLHSDT